VEEQSLPCVVQPPFTQVPLTQSAFVAHVAPSVAVWKQTPLFGLQVLPDQPYVVLLQLPLALLTLPVQA
jgi:hypothetical protein